MAGRPGKGRRIRTTPCLKGTPPSWGQATVRLEITRRGPRTGPPDGYVRMAGGWGRNPRQDHASTRKRWDFSSRNLTVSTLGVERGDCQLCLHREYIGHAGGTDSGFPGILSPSGLSPGWYTLGDR